MDNLQETPLQMNKRKMCSLTSAAYGRVFAADITFLVNLKVKVQEQVFTSLYFI